MLGERLRGLRQARGLSLRALARQVGLSATLLSQVERGVTEPSLTTLRQLATVFGASVSTLLEDEHAPPVYVNRPGTRSLLTMSDGLVTYERLTPGNHRLEVLRAVIAPGEASAEQPWSHDSIECVYVLCGALTVDVGSATERVHTGEAITLDSNLPHRYRNDTDEPCEVLLAISPPNP